MRYLLDTNTCVYAIKLWPAVLRRLEPLSPDDVAVSSITLAELLFGVLKSRRAERNRQSVAAFLRPFACLPFDAQAAETYAELRLALERSGRPIGERDLLIASVAAARRLTIVTRNTREFGRVPGLKVENWTA